MHAEILLSINGSVREIFQKKNSRKQRRVLSQYKMSETNFYTYCDNELKAIQWAKDKWGFHPQLYLEHKDKFDQIKLKILTVNEKSKGVILEAYQQLKRKKCFSKIDNSLPGIRYSGDKEGSWYS